MNISRTKGFDNGLIYELAVIDVDKRRNDLLKQRRPVESSKFQIVF